VDAGQRGTPAVPAFRQHRRLLPLISFHPKGRQLKSLILAFVALGESLSCSNCQLSDRNRKMITRLLAAALQSGAGDRCCRRRAPVGTRVPCVTAEHERSSHHGRIGLETCWRLSHPGSAPARRPGACNTHRKIRLIRSLVYFFIKTWASVPPNLTDFAPLYY